MKEIEKLDKYLDIAKELKKLWNIKKTGIPIVVGVLGTVHQNLEKSLVWFGLVLWHINHCRLLNAKSIFIHINSSISNNSVPHKYIFCLHTFKCQDSSISNNSVQYKYNRAISQVSRLFTNDPRDRGSIPGRVVSMLLEAALLNTQHYKVSVKWSNPENEVAPSPTLRYGSYWKGILRVTLY